MASDTFSHSWTPNRLHVEFKEIQDKYSDFLSAELVKENIGQWRVTMNGPRDTPYEEGKFQVRITFPEKYPFKPPTVKFTTRMYHPNIDSTGQICMDILTAEEWKPTIRVSLLLTLIRSLICDPCPFSHVDCEAAILYWTNRSKFDELAREMTRRYAVDASSLHRCMKDVETVPEQNAIALDYGI